MILRFLDGRIAEGNTNKEIVKFLKRHDFALPKSVRDYMETVKSRCDILGITGIVTDSVDSFIESLEKAGVAEIVEEEVTLC